MEASKDIFIHQKLGITKKKLNKGIMKYDFVRDMAKHCEENNLSKDFL